MTPSQVILAAGLMINSALYLFSVFAAGIFWGNKLAVWLSIAAMGVTYLSYALQLTARTPAPAAPRSFRAGLVLASVALGVLAGLALI